MAGATRYWVLTSKRADAQGGAFDAIGRQSPVRHYLH